MILQPYKDIAEQIVGYFNTDDEYSKLVPDTAILELFPHKELHKINNISNDRNVFLNLENHMDFAYYTVAHGSTYYISDVLKMLADLIYNEIKGEMEGICKGTSIECMLKLRLEIMSLKLVDEYIKQLYSLVMKCIDVYPTAYDNSYYENSMLYVISVLIISKYALDAQVCIIDPKLSNIVVSTLNTVIEVQDKVHSEGRTFTNNIR